MKNRYDTEEVKKYLYENVYYKVSDAERELRHRWYETDLKNKVEEFLQDAMIPELAHRPHAFQSKYLFTPNREFKNFVSISEMLNLEPFLLEYSGKFVARNIEKYFLCKPYFFKGLSKNHQEVFISKRIVDFNIYEGCHMRDIETLNGQNLHYLHHQMLEFVYPGMSKKVYEFDNWFDNNKHMGGDWYTTYLSLFVAHGILFENYLFNDFEENKFIVEKLKPSIENIKKIFGVGPIIVPVTPFDNQEHRHWFSYDYNLLNYLENLIENNSQNRVE